MTMISILIPWRSTDPQRVACWNYVRRTWEGARGIEVLPTGDGADDGPFSRTRAYNRAFADSHGAVVITHGANWLPHLGAIHFAAENAERHGWSYIYNAISGFTLDQTRKVTEGTLDPYTATVAVEQVPHGVPGALAIHRNAWQRIGGMDERFGTGYGYEDSAMIAVLTEHCGPSPTFGGHLRALCHGETGGAARITPANAELWQREYAPRAATLATPCASELRPQAKAL